MKSNDRAIFDYLAYSLLDHSDDTFLGERIKFPEPQKVKIVNPEIQLELLLNSAILRCFSSRMGIHLSAGIDSNFIRAVFSKAGERPHLFTHGFYGEADEISEVKELLTRKEKQRWVRTILKPEEVMPLFEQTIKAQGAPHGGLTTLAYFKMLGDECRKNINIALEGVGMDELAGGYFHYQQDYVKDRFGKQQFIKSPILDLLDDDFVKAHDREISFPQPYKTNFENSQYRDYMYTKTPKVVRINDRTAKMWNIKVSRPYLDKSLVDFFFSLPVEWKFRKGHQKALFRKVASKYIPNAYEYKKSASGDIQLKWARGPLKDTLMNIFTSQDFRNCSYWKASKVIKRFEEFVLDDKDMSSFPWIFLQTYLWLRLHR